jgi:hypothetical protein
MKSPVAPPHLEVYVCRNGAIRWGFGKWVMVSTTPATKYIGANSIVGR